ncbi:MAG: histidine--tRNA ligase [Planctomycetota bacterium]|jgi:histidyl-tRNA synthetase|nr:histidine--tRNA ligase [Planctomycetota bacterium]
MNRPQFRAIEGTRDYFGPEGDRFDKALSLAAELFRNYGYARVRTPVFEGTDLFARSIGAATDIVEKEMYTFSPGSDSLTLRPEGTAGAVRAYLQHGMDKQNGLVKLWYEGPMFRRERPQKGRQRQFHQIGVEAIGSPDPLLDAEIVSLGLRYYERVGIAGVGLRLNSIGCRKEECRPRYRRLLQEAIRPNLGRFCKNCQARFERNVLRTLDCKIPQCRELAQSLPKSHENLCPECAEHFAAAGEALLALGAPFVLDPTLVRGLDYYARTVFEFTHPALGAQNAIGGGGRYDGLVEELGGEATPAIGFALGVERILIAMEAAGTCACSIPLQVFGATRGKAAHRAMAGLAARLRAAGLSADLDYQGRSLKAQLRLANRRNAMCCLILGDDELERGEITVKDMAEGGGQATVSLFDCLEKIREILPCG